jgi:hypothetical protein
MRLKFDPSLQYQQDAINAVDPRHPLIPIEGSSNVAATARSNCGRCWPRPSPTRRGSDGLKDL